MLFLYTIIKVFDFPVPSGDVTYERLVSDIPAGNGENRYPFSTV
jgi:hypothetical protein